MESGGGGLDVESPGTPLESSALPLVVAGEDAVDPPELASPTDVPVLAASNAGLVSWQGGAPRESTTTVRVPRRIGAHLTTVTAARAHDRRKSGGDTVPAMRIERDGELAILRMEAGKANAMTHAMLDGLAARLEEALSSDARAIVLTGDGKAFSAGLALTELIDLDRAAMREAIDRFTRVMVTLFTAERPIVAAIDGHAIAGGCVLACQCDVRLVADTPLRIGLNEVQLGIGMPAVVLEPLRTFLPPASFLPVVLEGKLFAPAEAHALGLVDEVVPAGELHARACGRARELAAVPGAAFAQVKGAWRHAAALAMARDGDDVRERWLDTWFADEAQARLRAVVARIASRA